MKKLTHGLAIAFLLVAGTLWAPANAAPANPVGPATVSDVVQAQYRFHPRYHNHHRYRSMQVCKLRTVVRRGHHGQRIVTRVRVCR